jgi:ClpP class serine protease
LKSVVQEYFTKFKDSVVRARAGIDIEAVSTGAFWIGSKSVDMGLTDGVSSMDEQLTRLGK